MEQFLPTPKPLSCVVWWTAGALLEGVEEAWECVVCVVCVCYLVVTSARKVLAKLVEGAGHDAVRAVKGFLHAITMVDVNVNVQNTLMHPVLCMREVG